MDETRTRGIITDVIATLTDRAVPAEFRIILTGYDYFDAPCGIIPDVEAYPAPLNGIIIPEWIWLRSSELMLRAYGAIELVNCFFVRQITPAERAFGDRLADLSERFSGREGTREHRLAEEGLLAEFHATNRYGSVNLYRKILSDAEVFEWFSRRQQWDPNGIIHALQLLLDEAPKRNIVKPWLDVRTSGLKTRINHLSLIRDKQEPEALKLRECIATLARSIDPSVIIPA